LDCAIPVRQFARFGDERCGGLVELCGHFPIVLQLGLARSGGKRLARPGGLGRRGLVSVHILFSSGERRGEAAALGWVVGLGPFNSPCEGQKVGGLH
jgi:hypothetical protein